MFLVSLVLLAFSSSSLGLPSPNCELTFLKQPAVEDLSGITSHNFGRGGLSHMTIAGAIQTGDYSTTQQDRPR